MKTWTEIVKHVRETYKKEITYEAGQKTFKHSLRQHRNTHAPERDIFDIQEKSLEEPTQLCLFYKSMSFPWEKKVPLCMWTCWLWQNICNEAKSFYTCCCTYSDKKKMRFRVIARRVDSERSSHKKMINVRGDRYANYPDYRNCIHISKYHVLPHTYAECIHAEWM